MALSDFIRAHTRPGSLPRRTVRRIRSRFAPQPHRHPLAQIVHEFGRRYPDAFFVQVGANDGVLGDPLRAEIRERNWSGIMVEPLPLIFERLQQTWGANPKLILENSAIAEADGFKELYYIPETSDEGLPSWYEALATFRKDVLTAERHREAIPDIDERVTAIKVPCLTFDHLCEKHHVERIDLVQIDTEGYDYEIIKLIDLPRLRPRLIQYENMHLEPGAQAECLAHLRANGYVDISNPMDTLCLHRDELRNRSLRRIWNKVRLPDGTALPEPD